MHQFQSIPVPLCKRLLNLPVLLTKIMVSPLRSNVGRETVTPRLDIILWLLLPWSQITTFGINPAERTKSIQSNKASCMMTGFIGSVVTQ